MQAILFDLGNTLVSYYRRDEFRDVLGRALNNVAEELRSRDIETVSHSDALGAAVLENREPDDYRVRPMIDRLERIFMLSGQDISSVGHTLCMRFLEPIFAIGRIYEDTIPVLKELQRNGCRTAIVSNLPWGSPTGAWRDELKRLELTSLVDSVTLCGDVGYRKPARQIFEHAARSLGVSCDECMFVGDDLHWDVEGSRNAGMHPVLIDRQNSHVDYDGERIGDLRSLL